MMPGLISKIKEEVMTQSKIIESRIKEEPKVIEEKKENSNSSQVIHAHVTCDECGTSPIVGIRYKCVVCPDFDVCEKCEAKSTHDHPFLKIKHLKHTPLKIIAVIDTEEDESLEINGQKLPLPGLQQGLGLLSNLLGGRMNQE